MSPVQFFIFIDTAQISFSRGSEVVLGMARKETCLTRLVPHLRGRQTTSASAQDCPLAQTAQSHCTTQGIKLPDFSIDFF